jgi:hypothetical protein
MRLYHQPLARVKVSFGLGEQCDNSKVSLAQAHDAFSVSAIVDMDSLHDYSVLNNMVNVTANHEIPKVSVLNFLF